MPSLSTNNNANGLQVGTFTFFVPSSTTFDLDISSTPSKHIFYRFTIHIIVVILSFLLGNTLQFVGFFLKYHASHIYSHYNIYYVVRFIIFVFGNFLFFGYFTIYIVSYGTKYTRTLSLRWQYTIAIIIHIIITGAAIGYLMYHSKEYLSIYVTKYFCNTGYFDDGRTSNDIECQHFTYFNLYVEVLGQTVGPIVHCLILLILNRLSYKYINKNSIHNNLCHCSCIKDKPLILTSNGNNGNSGNNVDDKVILKKKNNDQSDSMKQSLIEMDEFNSTLRLAPNSDGNINMDELKSKVVNERKILLFFLLFWIVWDLFSFSAYITTLVKSKYVKKFWDEWYFIWLVLTSVTKFVLKIIGRKIDQLFINMIKDKNTGADNNYNYSHVSLEWAAELLMSLAYWEAYRTVSVVYLIQLKWGSLVFTLAVHGVTEFCQTSFTLSQFYFDQTSKFQDYVLNKVERINGGKFGQGLKYLVGVMYDDCNYRQWTIRCCIDIIIRFSASIVTFVSLSIWIRITFQDFYGFDKKQMTKSLIYLCIAFVVEFVYFLVAIYWHYKNHNKENLFRYYLVVVKNNQSQLMFAWFVIAVSGITLI